DGAEPPPPEALPGSINTLMNYQAIRLDGPTWAADLDSLVKKLEGILATHGTRGHVEYPTRCDHVARILQDDEIHKYMQNLIGWEVVHRRIPGESKSRRELAKTFKFASFPKAVEFMRCAAEQIEKMNHRPEWTNIWINVIVQLSTWNIGHEVSVLDFELAMYLESLYRERFEA